MLAVSTTDSFRDLKCLLEECADDLDDESKIPFKVRERAHKLCSGFLGGTWKTLDAQTMRLSRIRGGMTNMLFLCRLPEGYKVKHSEPSQVLLRVYFNPETESHLVSESVIFTLLSERHLGPRLYGIFNGGRLEEFIPSRPLSCNEITQHAFSMKIAQRLARIHQLDVPISKDPDYISEALLRWIHQLMSIADERRGEAPMQLINGKLDSPDQDNSGSYSNKTLMAELDVLKKAIACSTSPVVFCHNDLQEGNILLPLASSGNIRHMSVTDETSHLRVPTTARLVVIDFEYASYNYRAFDFANHFCEWTFDYDPPNGGGPGFIHSIADYPSEQQQRDFFRSYLVSSGVHDINEAQLKSMITETESFVAVSHFFWGVWALLQVEVSPVEFGFKEYAEKRLGLYFEHRAALTALNPEN